MIYVFTISFIYSLLSLIFEAFTNHALSWIVDPFSFAVIVLYSVNILYKQQYKTFEAPEQNVYADKSQEIEKWHKLFESGIISQHDYSKKKNEMLG
ncbi:MAG: hypothetical protein LBB39_03265 [Mycoplasmataceae bacterium]|nr:hypothetical protein [Mycoplasmataceae bacterium]